MVNMTNYTTENDTVIFATHAIVHNQRQSSELERQIIPLCVHILHYRATEVNLYRYGHSEDLSIYTGKCILNILYRCMVIHYMLRVHADVESKWAPRKQYIDIR